MKLVQMQRLRSVEREREDDYEGGQGGEQNEETDLKILSRYQPGEKEEDHRSPVSTDGNSVEIRTVYQENKTLEF